MFYKKKIHTWCLVTTFVPWMKACDSVLHFLSIDSQLIHIFVWSTNFTSNMIILLLSRDNVLCPITSFIHQVKKVESSTIHPLGCFKVMTKKLNCALVGFQCQLHTVQIQILIE